MYAYERNSAAQHWFKKMCEAKDPARVLVAIPSFFTEIVDRRFDVCEASEPDRGELFQMFWPSVRSEVEDRFRKWESHRMKTLFGDDAPSTVFLH